jgi:hypothetical protein
MFLYSVRNRKRALHEVFFKYIISFVLLLDLLTVVKLC